MTGEVHRHLTVATAGHVDHGKSTLLRALTGMEPDRWEEERRRGLTIDLGFVWCDLPVEGREQPLTVAFVDVPGHEKFVPNMLAGAGAVRLALFVVAADDGWSAQSEEHLEILDLLDIPAAVVAVTKVGLAGKERALEVAGEVGMRLTGTSLEGAPVLLTDAVDGLGIDDLRDVLASRLAAVPEPTDDGRARLWIDRSFTIEGAGTVVTGTLAGGSLAVDGEVGLLPQRRRIRLRGLHSLGQSRQAVGPGSRVAVNLAGIDRDAVGRGDALVTGASDPVDAWVVTGVLDAWVRVLPGAVIGRTGAWHVHVGSAVASAELLPLLGDELGGEGHVRVTLDAELPLQAGDRFVIRDAGRSRTAAGGMILDPEAGGILRGSDQRLARAEALDAVRDASDAGARVRALVEASGGARLAVGALAAAGLRPDQALPGDLGKVGEYAITPRARAAWEEAITSVLRRHHETAPASPGLPAPSLTEAAAGAGCPRDLAAALPDHLASQGVLHRSGTHYALAEHADTVDAARSRRRQAFLDLLAEQPLAPPRLDEAAKQAGLPPTEVQQLVQEGAVVRAGEIGFLASAVEDAAARLRELPPGFTASQARDAWGTTRKYAIPLLELLDARGVTVFDGQTRTLR